MPETEKSVFHQGLVLLTTIICAIRHWIPIREDSIRLLEEIADDLDDTQSKVNISKVFGASSGILGGVLLGAGALGSVLTLGAAVPFVIGAGIAGTAAGALVSGGAEVAMLIKSKEEQAKIKKALENDKCKQETVFEKQEEFKRWIAKFSREQNITEEKALNDLLERFLDTAGTEKKRRAVNLIKKRLLENLQRTKGDLSILSSLFHIAGAASGLGAFGIRTAAKGTAGLSPVLVAISAVELVTTVKDVKQGSKSKYGQQLRKIVDDLEEECKSYRELLTNFLSVREDLY